MDYTSKIPFISGASVTIIVGILSYKSGYELKTICIRMTFSMVVFFLIGIYLRSFIRRMKREVKQKKVMEEIKKNRELLVEAAKKNAQRKNSKINLTVGNDTQEDIHADEENLYDEEFKPLKVSNVTIADQDENSQQ
ncbi:MAG TPA: hypothetical protein PLA01_04855 [Acetivibrio sp.]|nr:hypothetical protein [Acetivibrio sp.]